MKTHWWRKPGRGAGAVWFLSLWFLAAPAVRGQSDRISTLAGQAAASGKADGVARAARFYSPIGAAADPAGNLYVADTWNNAIRKVATDGTTTTLAGGQSGSADGTGTNAQFNLPTGVAVDSNGNIYVTDQANDTIRKISPAGVVTTLAGFAGGLGMADGTGTNARFSHPSGLALDPAGNLYVADTWNSRIRMITASGAVVTLTGQNQVLGSVGAGGSADGPATNALFYYPRALAVDTFTNIYVADTGNNTIRKIAPDGTVSTLAGQAGGQGGADGSGTNARFAAPEGMQVDAAGNLYVADTGNNTIRRITPDGTVVTLAGQAGMPGGTDATGTDALFNQPRGLALGGNGSLLVVDSANNSIRRLDTNGVTTVLAGPGGSLGGDDGSGSLARFAFPCALAVDSSSNVYLADLLNFVVRKITPDGTASVLAGQTGRSGFLDGAASNSLFASPRGVAVDGAGNVYVADADNETIRMISNGVVSTLAGRPGQAGSTNGSGTNAWFNNPSGVAVDGAGHLYVADSGNNLIREVTPTGTSWLVTTLAGHAITNKQGAPLPSYLDGAGTNASFNNPCAAAVDPSGIVYVADKGNETIRMITPAGVVTTMAGTHGAAGSADGTGASARFSSMGALAAPWAGYVFVADTYNNTIRLILPNGGTTTLGGQAGMAGSADGVGTNALFSNPVGIAVDPAGQVYVADTLNNTIRAGYFPIGAPALTMPLLQIAGSPGQIILSWPASTPAFTLQTRPSFSPSGGVTWITLTNAPAQVGGQFILTNPAMDAAAFFRLTQP